MQTEITRKKIPCYICMTQLAGGLLLKKLAYFEVMLNIFWNLVGVRECRILVYGNNTMYKGFTRKLRDIYTWKQL